MFAHVRQREPALLKNLWKRREITFPLCLENTKPRHSRLIYTCLVLMHMRTRYQRFATFCRIILIVRVREHVLALSKEIYKHHMITVIYLSKIRAPTHSLPCFFKFEINWENALSVE